MDVEEKIGGTIVEVIQLDERNWDPLGDSHETDISPWVICWVQCHKHEGVRFFVGVRTSVEDLEVGRRIQGYYRDWSYFDGNHADKRELAQGALIGAKTSNAVIVERPLPREGVNVRQFKVIGGYEA